MNTVRNERALFKGQALIRVFARHLENTMINPADAEIHAMEFADSVKMVLGEYSPSSFYALSDDLDVMHSEVWFKNQQRQEAN